jgi:predicted ATPase
MINHIEIEYFRSFKHTETDLNSLTVLIGHNGGGKSNLIDFFEVLSEGAKGSLSDAIAKRGGFDNIRFRDVEDRKIFFKFRLSTQRYI